ncbi:glycosyltransferase family 2 protein [Halomonas mongoliensis]|uniref:glycosyltransferase family 2 protein n=1 Tax=Halomonas mongoliensis TaxID=321265 RepID=UPI00403B1FA3
MNVSVVIPLYNKEKTIIRAVSSVLASLDDSDELIIVDDGSTDASCEALKKIQDSRVRVLSKVNGGVSSARNAGVEASRNRYVAFLDADDIWHPYAVPLLKSMIESVENCVMYTFSHIRYSPEALAPDKISAWIDSLDGEEIKASDTAAFSGWEFVKLYAKRNIIHSSTVCVDKKVFQQVGGFPEGVKAGEDIYLWLVLASQGHVAVSKLPLALVERLPPGNAQRRDVVPYYMLWASNNKSSLKSNKKYYSSLKKFLFNRGVMNCSGRALAGYRKDVLIRTSVISKVTPCFFPFGLFIFLCPAPIFKGLYNIKKAWARSQ